MREWREMREVGMYGERLLVTGAVGVITAVEGFGDDGSLPVLQSLLIY